MNTSGCRNRVVRAAHHLDRAVFMGLGQALTRLPG
jgi:hypothetical protein